MSLAEKKKTVYLELKTQLLEKKLKLPGLPNIANRVQRAVSQSDYNASDIAKIIQTDIPLSGRLIQVANSPLYQGAVPVEHCQAAIIRLGMKTVKNLVASFSLRRLYTKKSATSRIRVEQLWKHSVKIGAISFTLARITPGFDPERAILAGLIHEIGELLILQFAESNDDLKKDKELLDDFILSYKFKLGALIVKQWRFDQALIDVVLSSEDWFRNPSEKPDYADVIMVSHIQEYRVKNRLPLGVSSFEELPVYEKFPVFKLGDHAFKELMLESKDEIAELQRLLK